jgi:tetratricopeptide (TPR) repeat protein
LEIGRKSADNAALSRQRRLSAVVAVLVAVAVAAASCGGGTAKVAKKPKPATAVLAGGTGQVLVRPAGAEAWFAGASTQPLFGGETLSTGKDSGALLLLASGYRAWLGERSFARISAGDGGSLIQLTRGEVRIDGNPDAHSIRVSTPSAEAKAKSSKFGVTVAVGGGSALVVADGTVSFVNGAAASTVTKSEQSFAAPGVPPSPPAAIDPSSAVSLSRGYELFVDLQVDRYFSSEESRDDAETAAKSQLSIDTTDPWAHVNLGRALLDAGNTSEARPEFEQAIALKPGFEQALCGMGRTCLLEGLWGPASDSYDQARRVNPGSIEALFGLGQAALGSGDLEEAQRCYKQVLQVDSQDDPAWSAVGLVRLLELDADSALEDFNSAIENDPGISRAHLGAALVYSLRGDRSRAAASLQNASRSASNADSIYASIGLLAAGSGALENAGAWFRRLEDSTDPAARTAGFQDYGAVDLLRGDARDALTAFQKAADLSPDGVGPLVGLGQAQALIGEGQQAIKSLSRAVALDPGSWYGHELLARAYLDSGMTDGAEFEAMQALGLNPSTWVSHAILGLCRASTGDGAGAKVEFEAAAQMGTAVPGGRLSAVELGFLGASQQGMRKYEEALELFKKAAAAAHGQGPAVEAAFHRYEGDVLAAMKRESEAMDEYQKALELNPSDSKASLSIARILFASGNKQQAIDGLMTSLEKDPNNIEVRVTVADYMIATGDIDGAIVHLEAARSVPGITPSAAANVLVIEGNAQDKLQAFPPAIALYTQALALDPGRGDAWFYLAGDFERTGRLADARGAYLKAVELTRSRPEWQQFLSEAQARLGQLR